MSYPFSESETRHLVQLLGEWREAERYSVPYPYELVTADVILLLRYAIWLEPKKEGAA